MTGPRMRTAATLAGMRAASDDRFVGPFRRRGWRRALVLGIVLVWGVTLVGWLRPPIILPFWGWVGTVPLTFGLLVLLTVATRNVSGSIDAFIDERERAVRDRAHRLAYWAFGAPFGALVGGVSNFMHRRMTEGVPLSREDLSALAAANMTAFLLFMLLPMAIIAWTEPDRLGFEDEDEDR